MNISASGFLYLNIVNKKWCNIPLHIAAVAADEEVIKVLLDAGADKTIQTSKGKTPFTLAKGHQRSKEILELLR